MEEEEQKAKLQNDIRLLTDQLAKVNESLSKKMASRAEFDRTIAETEAAYTKVYFLLLFLACIILLDVSSCCSIRD